MMNGRRGETQTELWDRYRQIRDDELRAGGDGTQATRFYRQHRRAMDAGAKVTTILPIVKMEDHDHGQETSE